MNLRDELRVWIRKRLKVKGYGAQNRLAEYLNLTPMQISNMLSTRAGSKSRNIQAEELLQIIRFFDIKIDDSFLSLETDSSTVLSLAADNNPDRTALMHIYDNAKPKQREAIVKLVRALAETYNIPH